MNLEFNTNQVLAFKEYLIRKNYSNHVIPMYTRGISAFLDEIKEASKDLHKAYPELKKSINKYTANTIL